jgi:hypothetical protein
MNSNDGHHKSSFRIEEDLLHAIRSGTVRPSDDRRLRDLCKSWIKAFGTGLSAADREDVVSGAIAEAMPAMLSKDYDSEEVSEILRKELQRFRAGSKRHSARMVDFQEPKHGRSRAHSVDEEQIATEDVMAMASFVKKLIAKAISMLPDRQHDLLIEAYGLDSIGFAPRHASPPSFPTDGARRTALSRARVSFSVFLEAMLEAAKISLRHDPHVVEQTLRFVRGESGSHPLILMSDLEDAVKFLRPTPDRVY